MINRSNSKVSIIMPSYNSELYLEDAIDSVLKQSYDDWELIIVDDCSSDKSRVLLADYEARDERIKVIHHKKNSGPSQARATAYKNKTGRYVAFLDSDDVWHKDKLSVSIERLRQSNSELVYTSYKRISLLGDCGKVISVPETISYAQLLSNTVILSSSVVIDDGKVGMIHFFNVYYDDFACWLDILKRGYRAVGINIPLTYYRVVGSGSVSGKKIKSAVKVWSQLREHEGLTFMYSFYKFSGYAVRAFIKHKL